MKWVTRERPKIDRVACPWVIARFIDSSAEFLFVPTSEVSRVASETGAIPYDVEGVELSHEGPLCSLDAFLKKYSLTGDDALPELAVIVRGADTARVDLAPQCAGLLAISLGLSRMFSDDHEQLRHGFVVYDALCAWLREAKAETHTWNPQRAIPVGTRGSCCCRFSCRLTPTLSGIAKGEQRQITLSGNDFTGFLPDFLLPFGRLISDAKASMRTFHHDNDSNASRSFG